MNLECDEAFEHQPAAMQLLGLNGTLLALNAAGRRLLEAASLEAAASQPFSALVAPEQRSGFLEFTRHVYEGVPGVHQFDLIGLGGTRRCLEVQASPVRNSVGGVHALLGILREVPAAVPSSREADLLASLLNQLPEAIYLMDDQFRFIHVNGAACASVGYSREQLLGMSPLDLTPSATPAVLLRLQEKLQTLGRLPARETLQRASNGDVFPVEVRFAMVAWGQAQHLAAVVRKLDKHGMQHDLLRVFIESTPDCIVRYDLQCRRIDVNPAMQRLLGLPRRKILGRTPAEIPIVDAMPIVELLRTVMSSGKSWHGELSHTDTEGKIIWGEMRVFPQLDEDNQVVGALSVWRDVTERRALEEQLRRAQKLEAIGQLASGVAHDFNNMLAAILLHICMLRTDSRLPPGLLEVFQELEEDVRRATNLPRQLLTFSRQQAMQAKPILVEEVVETSLKMLRRIVGEKVKIEFQPAQPSLCLFGDPGMIEQVVFNLCVNARDAMPEGGCINLATRRTEVDQRHVEKVGEARLGTFIEFRITDTGTGMDEATLARIFEPFFTTKDPSRGTGLGLATVFGIVKQHQGWIEVVSAVGNGTTFFIYLPLHGQDQRRVREVDPNKPAPRGDGETILLVEDDDNLCYLMAAMMRRGGYRVLEAADGVGAAKIWTEKDGQIDLLFSDMVIPGQLNGLELAQQFKRAKPDLRVVLTSGYVSEAKMNGDLKQLGFSYLAKPFIWEDLAEALRSTVRLPE